ncbi:MAG: DnaA regulatory inactivator HdaA [Rhizobium rhizophilum]|uniref:DnaA regulatory inactivator HdaA n=1 Tax=Rhizobium rhizophilum TaxID=1850373 RepID=UPI00391DAEA4
MTDAKMAPDKRGAAEQLPLAFEHGSATGRDDLLVSERMAAAVSIVDAWPNWPSPVVILTGPEGSGKSHLAQIFRDISGATDILPQPGEAASQAAANGPVLFEDADRKGFDEVELFHVINAVRQHGTTLLITSRSFPPSWNVKLADLNSRLKAATVVEIGTPDEELLGHLIAKLFADRQLYIDDKIVGYIVSRMERSFLAAQVVVDRMDRLALARRVKITRSLAAEVLETLAAADGTD